ncbi:MAG: AtpZ/AtpI family protein [Actinobacteria bacterium]|nr:AtpZ/AtpI family protein [Actinomycetota bacterium]
MEQAGARRGLYQGLDDANVRAIQLVVTPLLMALLGVYLDARVGTRPFLAIGFGVLGLFGECVRAYVSYQQKMKQAEEGKPWAK